MGLALAVPPARLAAQPRPRQEWVRADDGHRLSVWVKRPASPRGSILLLHGRTWSALPNFDLRVPGQRVSLMDALVARGFAVYALDQRGYGATPRDSTRWLTPSRAARDANDVLAWIGAHERGTGRPVLFGYSRGSLTAMLAALRDSTRMSALVLYGFPLDLSARDSIQRAPEPSVPARRPTTAAAAAEDFITPASTPPGVREAYVRAAIAADTVRADWRDEGEFRTMDPAALRVPVLLVHGERDPYAAQANLADFMRRLTRVDRSWVVLASTDHAAHLERQRDFVQVLVSFMERVPALHR